MSSLPRILEPVSGHHSLKAASSGRSLHSARRGFKVESLNPGGVTRIGKVTEEEIKQAKFLKVITRNGELSLPVVLTSAESDSLI